MLISNHLRFRVLAISAVAAMLLSCAVCKLSAQAPAPPPIPQFSFTVLVVEADTGDPISQARLTLTFKQTGVLHKTISYSAKTSAQGRYRFTNIPKQTVRLLVTAANHQSFGKEIGLEQDNQTIEVKLKKPQPEL